MKNVVVNGKTWNGVSKVQLDLSGGGTAEFIDQDETGVETVETKTGPIIHVVAAVPNGVQSLTLYDTEGEEIQPAELKPTIAITNKNLFRIDLLPTESVNQGVTFTKNDDGSITASGTSTGQYAGVACFLSSVIFQQGQVFTMSCGKTSGDLYLQLALSYTDGTTDYLVSRTSYTVFMVPKPVRSARASVQITNSGVTVSDTIYPMIELSGTPSAFEMNSYETMQYDGSTMPTLPDTTANIWSVTYSVASMTMTYSQTISGRLNSLQEQNDATSAALAEAIENNPFVVSNGYLCMETEE